MLELKTVANIKDGLFSVLMWLGVPFAVSVERTFDDGGFIIKAGTYRCVRSFYYKGGYQTFEIIVEGHTRILFHKGNIEEHSLGCVIVAESFGVFGGKTAVLDASHGFSELMQLSAGLQEFPMIVTGR